MAAKSKTKKLTASAPVPAPAGVTLEELNGMVKGFYHRYLVEERPDIPVSTDESYRFYGRIIQDQSAMVALTKKLAEANITPKLVLPFAAWEVLRQGLKKFGVTTPLSDTIRISTKTREETEKSVNSNWGVSAGHFGLKAVPAALLGVGGGWLLHSNGVDIGVSMLWGAALALITGALRYFPHRTLVRLERQLASHLLAQKLTSAQADNTIWTQLLPEGYEPSDEKCPKIAVYWSDQDLLVALRAARLPGMRVYWVTGGKGLTVKQDPAHVLLGYQLDGVHYEWGTEILSSMLVVISDDRKAVAVIAGGDGEINAQFADMLVGNKLHN